jgi:hypothetical protein
MPLALRLSEGLGGGELILPLWMLFEAHGTTVRWCRLFVRRCTIMCIGFAFSSRHLNLGASQSPALYPRNLILWRVRFSRVASLFNVVGSYYRTNPQDSNGYFQRFRLVKICIVVSYRIVDKNEFE